MQKKREIIDGCEDIIFTMQRCAIDMIESGDDSGLLALFWINYWIKKKPTSGDEDYYEKTGKHRQVPLYVHPNNFGWAFNRDSELGEKSNTHARLAIETVYERVGGSL